MDRWMGWVWTKYKFKPKYFLTSFQTFEHKILSRNVKIAQIYKNKSKTLEEFSRVK